MPNRQTKIEALGLAPRVQELVTEGISARRIAVRVRNENPDLDISDSAVIRFVTRVRKVASEEAFDKIRKHVDRVVPDDLAALEEMESQSLEWSREAGKDRLDRMAEAAVEIQGEIAGWKQILLENKDEAAVKQIIRRCLSYMAREDRLQEQRTQAMMTAIKIIDLKLRQAGLLDEEGKGRIVIVDRISEGQVEGERLKTEGKKGYEGYKPYVIPGGKPNSQ